MKKYVVILNFEKGEMDTVSLECMPKGMDVEEYLTLFLDYDLGNCEWMVTEHLVLNKVNF